MMEVTLYPYVNEVLQKLLERARGILADEFVGMYLYGSLADGDFNPQRSDIDFIIVTRRLLPPSTIEELGRMHLNLAQSEAKWARKLEGQYIPLDELRRYNAHGPQLPTINEGQFYLAGQGSDWVIQRHVLREQETIVAGPSIRDYIDPVSAAEMRDAVSTVMREWWAPMLDDPGWLDGRPEYQVFAVQTMCRVLYTLDHGTAVSKTAAARWAIESLDGEWEKLISDASNWKPDRSFDHFRTLEFIRFVAQQTD